MKSRRLGVLCGSALIVVGSVACGQKGPPLPPLVLIPAPPALTAERHGATIEVNLTVPSANADGSRPANIARIDVFAVTGSAADMSDLEMAKVGTRVASLPVKAPRNPNDTVEPGESTDVLEPPEGKGLDQGAASKVAEEISAAILKGTSDAVVRTYISVGVDKRGHLGRFSRRVEVPLALAPPPPSRPKITYTETAITVRWNPRAIPLGPAPEPGLLPSRPLGTAASDVAFNVYDSTAGTRLTPMPVKETEFEDTRIEWGATRCYVIRAVQLVGTSNVESNDGEPSCEKLVDTFPPAAPKALRAVATDGAINLIWEVNTEPDLAGYYVRRTQLPGTTEQRLTPTPLQDASFLDNVQPGVRFAYVVVAVDKAGNMSAPSNRVEETAR